MKMTIVGLGAAGFLCVTGCYSEKGTVAADTAAASSTTLGAPVSSPVPVTAAPDATDSVGRNTPAANNPATTPAGARRSGSASSRRDTNRDTVIGWDSVIKPRATIDTKGNVQPIKRDSL